jgi:hypothetical protein
MVYLSSQCHVRLHLDKVLTRRVQATWVDPRSGDEREAGLFETGNATGSVFPRGQAAWFSVPGHWEDAVLLLDGVGEAP